MIKSDDGRHFDHCEPILKLAQSVDLHGVERNESSGNQHHPNPLRNIRQPKRNIDTGGRDFRTDGDDLRDTVSSSNRKTCPGIEVFLGVNSNAPATGCTTAISASA